MDNIFENAYFGKAYKTRDGRKAVYIKYDKAVNKHCFIPDKDYRFTYCYDNGIVYDFETCADIVSEWQEEVNEEKLDELADAETCRESDEFNSCLDDILALLDSCKRLKTIYRNGLILAFKTGYRKAKEE